MARRSQPMHPFLTRLLTPVGRICFRSIGQFVLLIVAMSAQNVLAQVYPDLNGGWRVTETITLTTSAQFRWIKGPTSAALKQLTHTGYKKLHPEKMETKKYDPTIRKHVVYKEAKIK